MNPLPFNTPTLCACDTLFSMALAVIHLHFSFSPCLLLASYCTCSLFGNLAWGHMESNLASNQELVCLSACLFLFLCLPVLKLSQDRLLSFTLISESGATKVRKGNHIVSNSFIFISSSLFFIYLKGIFFLFFFVF